MIRLFTLLCACLGIISWGLFQAQDWNTPIRSLTALSTITTLDSIIPIGATSGQSPLHQHHHAPGHSCGADALQQKLFHDNPLLKSHQDSMENIWERLVTNNHNFNASRTIYTVPVVVHLIHNNGPGNISDAQVQTAIQYLNDAYANVGAFNPATGVDAEIRFCLAQRDPMGNTTNGITRTVSPLTSFDKNTQNLALKNLIRWDPLQYINIWVVNEIIGSVAGYAYFPSSHGSPNDGVVIEKDFMGVTSSYTSVLVHEMGHYFGLYHTFEGGCTNINCLANGDRVCDTPPDNTTARPPCATVQNSCTSDEDDTSMNNPFRAVSLGGAGDQPDQKENYMDYSDLACYDRFSQGQANRMQFFLLADRASLLTSPACQPACFTNFSCLSTCLFNTN